MFLYTAPVPRTGKSKLNDMGAALSHGTKAPVIAASSDPKELDKALAAALISGASQITLDNLSEGEALHSDLLSQCLTQEMVIVRKFGKNDEDYHIPNTAIFIANGNNLTIRKDLVERAVLCELDAEMEQPGTRVFDFDPVVTILSDRPRYVRDVIIILRAYAAAGYPGHNEVAPFGGFEDWNKKVRCALIWLGCDDPCKTTEVIRKSSPDKIGHAEMIEAWEEHIGINVGMTVAEAVINAVKLSKDLWENADVEDIPKLQRLVRPGNPRLLAAMQTVARSDGHGGVDTVSLGKWFKKKNNQICNGKKFVTVKYENSKNAARIFLFGEKEGAPSEGAF